MQIISSGVSDTLGTHESQCTLLVFKLIAKLLHPPPPPNNHITSLIHYLDTIDLNTAPTDQERIETEVVFMEFV